MTIDETYKIMAPLFTGTSCACEMCGESGVWRYPCPSCGPDSQHGAGLCDKHYSEIMARKNEDLRD